MYYMTEIPYGSYGFCYVRRRLNGRKYTVCPGYKNKKKIASVKFKATTDDVLEDQLLKAGFKKFSKTVAAKMRKSGRPIQDYSKSTGQLKKKLKK